MSHATAVLIGPNAVIQLAGAIEAVEGTAAKTRIFDQAGVAHYLARPPETMIAESDVAELHRCMRAGLGSRHSASISWVAGHHTANYLLANRIPRPVQRLLKLLPAPLAGQLLMAAIARHAWTFVGSGKFSYRGFRPVLFEISDSLLSRGAQAEEPCCTYYAATFERLFTELVSPAAAVTETACAAMGAPACRFRIDW
jgi:divinyl protochlorophyllide a 8-vinyl-reductase